VERTPAAIAAAALSVVDAFTFCILSYAEHGRNLRPSAVLGAYLFFSLLFDIVRVRTLWLIGEDTTVARLFTTSVVLKAVILLLEAKEKREFLRPEDQGKGPEELSSIFSQSIFYWLNQLISSGYSKILSLQDLYPLDAKLEAQNLGPKLSVVWNKCECLPTYTMLFH
jgi:ATP-binding cassette subfamily C (CFTR/MRP) protein 1